MAAAEVGIATILIKWGGWILAGITTSLLAVLGVLIKDRNDVITQNTETTAKLTLQVSELLIVTENRDRAIDELTAKVAEQAGTKDKVLVLSTQFNSFKEDLKELKTDFKEYLNSQRK